MSEYHDIILMCATAGGIFAAIRADLKFMRYRLGRLEKSFTDHMRKHHGE